MSCYGHFIPEASPEQEARRAPQPDALDCSKISASEVQGRNIKVLKNQHAGPL